jgi:hypothetical protein
MGEIIDADFSESPILTKNSGKLWGIFRNCGGRV